VMPDKSESNARTLLSRYVDAVTTQVPEHIQAILLVGSLATGSYVAGPGADVDQVTVLTDDSSTDTVALVLQTLTAVERELGSGIPLARSVYLRHELERPFRTDFERVLQNKKQMDVPVELLRMHEHGQVVWGDRDVISRLPIPTREEVIFFDELTREWSRTARAADPALARPLRDLPLRISAQVLLVNAFRHYYYATGRSCSDKLAIAQRMRQEVPGYLFQAALESATELKSNLGNPDYALPTDRAEYLVAQAELVRQRIEHRPIHEVPLADDRASWTGGGNG
jgi:hypothetical protein